VVGTFLPWLHSGRRIRNSYATDGAMRRLLDIHGLGGAALTVWPFVGLACAGAVAAYLVGWVRWAAAICVVAALGAAAGAITMLSAASNTVIQPANAGPIVTLAGSLATLAGASMAVLRSLRSNGRGR